MIKKVLIAIWIMGLACQYACADELIAEDSAPINARMKLAIAELNHSGQDENPPNLGISLDKTGDKSIAKAALFSLILPGSGEYYLGHKTRAKVFFGAEAVTWGTYATYKKVADWRREDLDVFTNTHADIDVSDREDEFLQILKRYPRSENLPNLSGSYNEGVRRDARYYYPGLDDAEAREQYEQENYLTGDNSFTWDTRANWIEYRVLLHSYRDADQKAFYLTGVAFLTRLISVIDTIWLGKKYKKMRLSENMELELGGNPLKHHASLILKVKY
ncbi:MAG: hypothetical protein B6244_02335 [Candidatus Cloacimonetes bacterium 4572_55]|nr:MAG: hypothetical protein B6244_02335 [Candidatus Cloacimonetes bacterium 4572_55]